MSTPTNPDYNGRTPEPDLVPQSLRGYRFWQIMLGMTLDMANFEWNEDIDSNGLVQTKRTFALKGQYGGEWPLEPHSPMTATCPKTYVEDDRSNEHKAPSEQCTCGIYARYTLDRTSTATIFNPYTMEPSVSGAIKATGKTLMGELGFRTETAEIEALVIPYKGLHPNSIESIYKVADMLRVRLYHDVHEFLYDFPPSDLSALGIEPVKQDVVFPTQIPGPVTNRQVTITGRRVGKEFLRQQMFQNAVPDAGYSSSMSDCGCASCNARNSVNDPTVQINWQWNTRDSGFYKAYMPAITQEQALKIARDLMGGGA